MTYRIAVSALLAMVVAFSASMKAHGEEAKTKKPEWRKDFEEWHPEVPDALWKGFLEEVMKRDDYRFMQALRAEKVLPLVKAWSKELGRPLVPIVYPAFRKTAKASAIEEIYVRTKSEVVYDVTEGVIDGMPYQSGSVREIWKILCVTSEEISDDTSVRFVQLQIWDKENPNSSERETTYRVPARRLSCFQFQYVDSIVIPHLMNRTVKSYSVMGETLSRVIRSIFQMGSIDVTSATGHDFALNRAAHALLVNLKTSNRTARQVLQMAVAAAGWKIQVSGKPLEGAFVDEEIKAKPLWSEFPEVIPAQREIDLTQMGGAVERVNPESGLLSKLRAAVFKKVLDRKKTRHQIIIGP